MFANVDALTQLAASFFRIRVGSAAVDQADPASSVMTDIDGQNRPKGNGRDIGADELE
jgi:hypothetical protein